MPSLYHFQRVGSEWLAGRKVALLSDDMGLGKSAQSIRAADLIDARRILVVCPAIARHGWAREFTAWQEIDRPIQIISAAADAPKARGFAGVVIVSYALLTITQADLCAGPRYDLCVYDESQALKNPAAKRTQAVFNKSGGLLNHSARHWLLSGTPMPNHPGEIWPAAFCLFGHKLKLQEFIERFCIVKSTAFGEQIAGANPTRLPELAAFLKPHMLQRKQHDVLPDLPPLRFGHIPVDPGAASPQPDIGVDADVIVEKLEADKSLSPDEQAHLETLRRWAGLAKLPSLIELVRAELESRDKIVLFAIHRSVIAGLAAGLGDIAAVIDGTTSQTARQARIDAFQRADQPKVLILQLHAGGTAITLHRSDRVIFAQVSWTPADLVQAAKRLHRIGQKKSVLASVVSLTGSVEERICGVLMKKARELAALEALVGAA